MRGSKDPATVARRSFGPDSTVSLSFFSQRPLLVLWLQGFSGLRGVSGSSHDKAQSPSREFICSASGERKIRELGWHVVKWL